jgi:hypothetical protein
MSSLVLDAFAGQAKICDDRGSPFTAALCRLLAERLDRSSEFGRRILDWAGDPASQALPLRACAALHMLARSGKEPALTAAYPPNQLLPEKLWAAVADGIVRHDGFLAAGLESPPQTNEVARSQLILGAALVIAAQTGLPLTLYEIGASAGITLAFEQYRYDFGNDVYWGPSTAPLTLACTWRGKPPLLDVPIGIAGRYGCDRSPLDPAALADRERLMSYIWADQPHRLTRMEAALKHAAEGGTKVDKADAADWVERQFGRPQRPGAVRVLIHSLVWQYLPPDVRSRIERVLDAGGRSATREAPLACFGFEDDGHPDGGRMHLTIWPGGETVTLGRADTHGRWINWA